MALTPEQKAMMIAATRDAAIAFAEDVDHLRKILGQHGASLADIRHLSAILRRFLVDDDLQAISAPRVGKLVLKAQDNNPIYRAEGKKPYVFVATAGAGVFGFMVSALIFEHGRAMRPMPDFHPDKLIDLRLNTFMTQRVFCLNGRWISRRETIKYLANVASGVHSGSAQSEDEKALVQIRKCAHIRLGENGMEVAFNPFAIAGATPPLSYDPKRIDPVLLEVVSTAHFLVNSPSIQELEGVVRAEMA